MLVRLSKCIVELCKMSLHVLCKQLSKPPSLMPSLSVSLYVSLSLSVSLYVPPEEADTQSKQKTQYNTKEMSRDENKSTGPHVL